MRRTRRFDIHHVYPRGLQRIGRSMNIIAEQLGLFSTNPEPEDLYSLVEPVGIRKGAFIRRSGVECRLRFKSVGTEVWRDGPAEGADISESIQVMQRYEQRLHTAHGQPCHRAIIAVRDG